MNYPLAIAAALAVIGAPAWAQSHDHNAAGTATKPTVDHGKMNHDQTNHSGAQHGGGPRASMLRGSIPADGAVLPAAPAALSLFFAHPVVLQNVTLVNAAGKTTKVAVPATTAPTADYQLKLPKLPKGAYTVNWNAGGQHQMSGRVMFQVR